jgi:hypothetical protein
MATPGLVSATPWNHVDPNHSTPFETASEESRKHERKSLLDTFVGASDLSEHNRFFLKAAPQLDSPVRKKVRSDSKNDIADGFLHLTALPTYALDRLSRYEHLLWRQARQIVFTLESWATLVAAIIASFIKPATKSPGGRISTLTPWRSPKDFGRKAIRGRLPSISKS